MQDKPFWEQSYSDYEVSTFSKGLRWMWKNFMKCFPVMQMYWMWAAGREEFHFSGKAGKQSGSF